MACETPFRANTSGVTVALQVTPKAAHDRIDGVAPGPDGRVLKVKVTAAPDRGKANDEVIRLLAKAWGLAPSRLTLASGETSRRKVVQVSGDPAALLAALNSWKDGLDG